MHLVDQPTTMHFMGGGVAAHVYALVAKDILGDALTHVTMVDTSHVVPDRTLCVWSADRLPISAAAIAQWHVIRIGYGKGHVDLPLQQMQYCQYTAASIRSLADSHVSITRITGRADAPSPEAAVSLDSCERERDAVAATVSLLQHFRGWRIQTHHPMFSIDVATMMDFRVDQGDGVCFVYVLPYSEQEALVECTVFSSAVWQAEEYETRLRAYIHDIIGATEYKITATEVGVIPMTDRVPERLHGPSWFGIGTAGGLTKPTTGYTVSRCVRDATTMIKSYQSTGSFSIPAASHSRFRWYDQLLLRIIRDEPHQVPRILCTLFQRNPIERILRFLDEGTRLQDEIKIFWSLPWRPFLRAIFRR